MNNETIFAFIDSQNLNLGTLSDVVRNGEVRYKGWKVDFVRFYKHLKDKYKIDKCFLFIRVVAK